MKKTLLSLAFTTLSLAAVAQQKPAAPGTGVAPPAGYTDLLAATIVDLMSTGDPARVREYVSKFERAAAAMPTDWLPRYYQAYGNTMVSFVTAEDGDAKDKYLDQAEAALAQARKLGGEASELLVLQAYIYQARLGISPMARSAQYSRLVSELLGQAKALNPANPRTYLVLGNNVYFTPKMMGGGPAAAKPLFEEAKTRFAAFRPGSPLAPSWGERQVTSRLKGYEQPAPAPPAAGK